ncbi:DUF2845 domain-containing protein [Kaarinaea lacus]
MKNYNWCLAVLLLAAMSSVSYAQANMRCGSKVISVGDSKAEVLLKCGEPLLKEAVAVKEESKRINIPLTSETDNGAQDAATNANPAEVQRKESITKTVDQWTYNQGSGRLLKILTFEGGELVDIATGDRQ